MGYDLHIERLGEDKDGESIPIPLEEWKTAVAATPGVRLLTPGVRQETAPDGSTFNLPIQDGDVEVLFPDSNEWEYVFRWRKSIGTAAFGSRSFDPGDSSHPVWIAAVAIASRLHAAIRGDDGESYDLQTGEIIDA